MEFEVVTVSRFRSKFKKYSSVLQFPFIASDVLMSPASSMSFIEAEK